ncbi:MAG: hypothetical protein LUG99_16725 [Lachnospiraceae bacterium]|nr:hypothetical protein [Lachnospiraceae bacterium]
MKTLYLHIGTPKTATSSIQVFCLKNRRRFRKYNYCFPLLPLKYPNIPLKRNAHFLVEASAKCDMISVKKQEETDSQKQDSFWEKRLSSALSAIHRQFDRYDNIILSDENLWRSMSYNQQNPLDILIKDGSEYGYRTKVIVYLRRQDQFLISRWNQLVKDEIMRRPFPKHLKRVLSNEPLIADYAAALGHIAAKIGKDNIIVRRFEASAWVGGSIYSDFTNAAGLTDAANLKLPKKKVNPGLKLNYAEIQRRINASRQLSEEDKTFLGYFLRKTSAGRSEHEEYGILSEEETRAFLARFEEGNQRIAREYFGENGPLFSDEIKCQKKWTPDNAYMEEDLLAYLAALGSAARGHGMLKFRCLRLLQKTGPRFL